MKQAQNASRDRDEQSLADAGDPAIACVIFLPLWIWLCVHKNIDTNFIVPILAFIVGMICAVWAIRGGSRASRLASLICLFFLLLMGGFVVTLVIWLSNTRFA